MNKLYKWQIEALDSIFTEPNKEQKEFFDKICDEIVLISDLRKTQPQLLSLVHISYYLAEWFRNESNNTEIFLDLSPAPSVDGYTLGYTIGDGYSSISSALLIDERSRYTDLAKQIVLIYTHYKRTR